MPEPRRERRTYASEIAVEERADGAPEKIRGHAAVFNAMSEDLGFFREIIRPGAFKNALERSDVRALFNHNPDYVLGRTSSRTLLLHEDQRGLHDEIDPPDTQWARDLLVSMKRGDINQQSFGFTVLTDSWRMENGEQIREVIEFDELFDVSPVTYPAYPQTDASVRHLFIAEGLDFEGLSAAFVKHVRGLDLSAADRDIVKRAVTVLAVHVEEPAQGGEAPVVAPEEPQKRSLAVLRRRLRMASLR